MKQRWYQISSLVWAAAIAPAAADLVLEEGFNYPNGPIVGALDSPWQAHSGAGNGPVQVEDGRLVLRSDQAEDINAPLLGEPYEVDGPVTALYAGMTLRVTALPTVSGAYFAHFRNLTTAHRARVWISQSETADRFRLGIGNSSGASAETGPWPADLLLDTDYHLVIRYELASGLSTIWIDPVSEADPGVTATDSIGLVAISTVAFRQSRDIGVILTDDLAVGDSFADVVPQGVRLRIIQAGPEWQVSWPVAADGYVLQSTPDLADPLWGDVDGTPVVEGGDYVVRLPADAAEQYFRLIKR